jgi:hypothetical protein
MAGRRQKVPRMGNAKRYFFAVLDPFLINEQLPRKWAGRIARSSIHPIWEWLCRDLAPKEMATYQKEVTAALQDRDEEKARALVAGLQTMLLPILQNSVATYDEAALYRFAVLIGGQAVLDDLCDMMVVMKHRVALNAWADKIGKSIWQLDDHQALFIANALMPFARDNASVMPHAIALTMGRLAKPWQILRVAAVAMEGPDAARTKNSIFSVVAELLLCELERLVARAQTCVGDRRGEGLALAAKDFAVHVRPIVNHLEQSSEVAWIKRVGAVRSRMAEVLQVELEGLPGRVRRILRAPDQRDIERGAAFDDIELASIEASLDYLVVIKTHAAELALNEVTLRVNSQLCAFLEASITPLLSGLRNAVDDDRAFRLQQLDGAIRIARRVLGSDYAATLEKAAAERRPLPRSI